MFASGMLKALACRRRDALLAWKGYTRFITSFSISSETFTHRCIDFVTYYPTQNIPLSGSCGYLACGGTRLQTIELAADADFNRTFGTAAATCTTDDDEVRGR